MVVDIGPPNGYVHVDPRTIVKVRSAADHQLRFEATDMRREKTGFHAMVSIHVNGRRIAYTVLNIGRDEDRVRFGNQAYKQLVSGDRRSDLVAKQGIRQLPEYPIEYFKDDLDTFCFGLEEAHIEYSSTPGLMRGSMVRHRPSFVLEPFILNEAGTLLFAAPGQGKSYALWLMAVCIDAGLDTLWPVTQTKVLVVNLERSERSVADRLGNINSVLGLDRDRPVHTLNARGKTLEQVRYGIEKYIRKEGIGVVLLDSMSRAGRGSLLDDAIVNGYCDILNGFGVAWLALCHSPRGDSSHVFGSVMFEAAADLTVKLESYSSLSSSSMGLSLNVEKRNDIGPQAMWIGSLGFDEAGLTSARVARDGEFTALDGTQVDDEEALTIDRIRAWIETVGPCSATDAATNLGINRSMVARYLSTREEHFRFIGKNGRDALYGLVGTSSRAGSVSTSRGVETHGETHQKHMAELETHQKHMDAAELPF